MSFERHPGSISAMPDDQLGTVAVSLVVSELTWSPDVSPAVLDRVSRDAVAYPEQFDRRPRAPTPQRPLPPAERSAKRAIGRIAVFGVILVIILGLVAFVTAANASAADLRGLRVEPAKIASGFEPPFPLIHAGHSRGTFQPRLEGACVFGDACSGTIRGADVDEVVAGSAAFVPIGANDGTLVSFGVDQGRELYAVDHGGRILHVVTEAS